MTQKRVESPRERGGVELWCEDADGVVQGLRRAWWAGGQLRHEIPYRDGVADGVAQRWYADGRLESKRTYRGGKLDGPSSRWHEDGKLASEVRFELDRRVGIGRSRDARGRLETRDLARDPPPVPARAVVTAAGGVRLRQLGDVRPGATYRGETGKVLVDRAPVVLWADTRPAAVLALSTEWRGRDVIQRLSPVAPAALPGFPIVVRSVEAADGTAGDGDRLEPRALVPADLDGDGVQELVVGRARGGVDVYSLRGRVSTYASPAEPGGKAFRYFSAKPLHLEGRDVVYVVSEREGEGVDDRNLLLRVDASGVARVRLEGLDRTEIVALGAIQRSGSEDVDELLALVPDGSEAAVVRFRPDGSRIGALRANVPPDPAALWFIPRSRGAVLEVPGRALVIRPDEPVPWTRELRVQPEAPPAALRELLHFRDVLPAHARLLHVADADGDPKLVYRVDEALWAVDRHQRCFTPTAGGRWAPLPGREPYRILPVPLDEALWSAWEDGDGRVLAATTRGAGHRRPVTHDEWRQAGDRYLPRAEAEAFRRRLEPSYPEQLRRSEVDGEALVRKIDRERIRSVEDWRLLLPDSYAAVAQWNADRYDEDVGARLRALRVKAGGARLPEAAGLRAFVDGLELPAHVAFTVVDGPALSSAVVPGLPPRELETQRWAGVEYRIHDGKLTAVMALEKVDPGGRSAPAFYEIEAPLAAR
jgi:hypothetical protein